MLEVSSRGKGREGEGRRWEGGGRGEGRWGRGGGILNFGLGRAKKWGLVERMGGIFNFGLSREVHLKDQKWGIVEWMEGDTHLWFE